MTILVVGASGATGRLLVKELLKRGLDVKVIVRSSKNLPSHKHLTVIQGSILDMKDTELTKYVMGCDAVASCLGHNISFKGIYGQPRLLVTEAVRRLCLAIKNNETKHKIKFVLMNTAGNSNRNVSENISTGEKLVIGIIRLLIPPHVDNEKAADYLRTQIGGNDKKIAWVAVRPDSLIDKDEVTEYAVYPSPIRSALFNPGFTSRINVAHFMADLIIDKVTWEKWEGKMPVIYNKESLLTNKVNN